MRTEVRATKYRDSVAATGATLGAGATHSEQRRSLAVAMPFAMPVILLNFK